eukprot:XP_001691790.1 predicted protein [Chlamydomonas reinhardtii]
MAAGGGGASSGAAAVQLGAHRQPEEGTQGVEVGEVLMAALDEGLYEGMVEGMDEDEDEVEEDAEDDSLLMQLLLEQAGEHELGAEAGEPWAPVNTGMVLLSADSAVVAVWLGGRLLRHRVHTGYTVSAVAATLNAWAPELSACEVLVRSGDVRVWASLYGVPARPPAVDRRDARLDDSGDPALAMGFFLTIFPFSLTAFEWEKWAVAQHVQLLLDLEYALTHQLSGDSAADKRLVREATQEALARHGGVLGAARAFVSGHPQLWHILSILAKNPMIWTMFLALAISVSGLRVWLDPASASFLPELGWIAGSLAWVNGLVVPLSIFSNGTWMYGKRLVAPGEGIKMLVLLLIKVGLLPLLMVGCALAVGLGPQYTASLTLLTLCPAAATRRDVRGKEMSRGVHVFSFSLFFSESSLSVGARRMD